MTFEKFTKKSRRGPVPSEFANLEINECYLTDKDWDKLYRMIYSLQRRTGKEFVYQKIKYGYIVKRIK